LLSVRTYVPEVLFFAWRSKPAEEAKEKHMADKSTPAGMFLIPEEHILARPSKPAEEAKVKEQHMADIVMPAGMFLKCLT
jgi:hypothetical protein